MNHKFFVWNQGHKVCLQEREIDSPTSKFSLLSTAVAVGLFESAVQSAAPGDLSIHLLWPRSNAPDNTPFLFYSTSLLPCRVAQQNYVSKCNYQSKLWFEKLRRGKLLTGMSSMNLTPKRGEREREGRKETQCVREWEDAEQWQLKCDSLWTYSTAQCEIFVINKIWKRYIKTGLKTKCKPCPLKYCIHHDQGIS